MILKPEKVRFFQKYMEFSTIGFEFVSAVVLGTLVGYLLDRYFGTKPVCVLVGAFVGIGVGIYNFIRRALVIEKKFENKEEFENEDGL